MSIEAELRKYAHTFDGAEIALGQRALQVLLATVAPVPNPRSSAAKAGFCDIRVSIVDVAADEQLALGFDARGAVAAVPIPEMRQRWVVFEAIDGQRLHRVGLKLNLPELAPRSWRTTPEAIRAAHSYLTGNPSVLDFGHVPLLLRRVSDLEIWPALPESLAEAMVAHDGLGASRMPWCCAYGFDLRLLNDALIGCRAVGSTVRVQWPQDPGSPLRFDVTRDDAWFTSVVLPMSSINQAGHPPSLVEFAPGKTVLKNEAPGGQQGVSGGQPPFPGGG